MLVHAKASLLAHGREQLANFKAAHYESLQNAIKGILGEFLSECDVEVETALSYGNGVAVSNDYVTLRIKGEPKAIPITFEMYERTRPKYYRVMDDRGSRTFSNLSLAVMHALGEEAPDSLKTKF